MFCWPRPLTALSSAALSPRAGPRPRGGHPAYRPAATLVPARRVRTGRLRLGGRGRRSARPRRPTPRAARQTHQTLLARREPSERERVSSVFCVLRARSDIVMAPLFHTEMPPAITIEVMRPIRCENAPRTYRLGVSTKVCMCLLHA